MKTRVVFPGALDLLEHRAREGTCASSHATTGRCTRIGVTRGRLVQFWFVQHNLIDGQVPAQAGFDVRRLYSTGSIVSCS